MVENLSEISEYLGLTESESLKRLGLDGRIVCLNYAGPSLFTSTGKDGGEWGIPSSVDYGSINAYPFSSESAIREIEAYAWPNPDLFDYHMMSVEARNLQKDYATRGPYWRPVFDTVCALMGMEEALISMLICPHVFEAILEKVACINYKLTDNLLKTCGDALDIYCLGDDFATQKGMLFSATLWRKYLKPIYAKLFEMAHEAGKPVWFHSCGDITDVLPDLIDIGIDVWETVQLHTLPFSPEELKRRYGNKLTFFGGINTQKLPFSDINAIRDEVRHCIKILGKAGGYICGPDHHIKYDIPADKTLALFDTAQQFKADGYTI